MKIKQRLLNPGLAAVTRFCFGLLIVLLIQSTGLSADAARITSLTTSAQGDDFVLNLEFDGQLSASHLFYLDAPQRIVIDLAGVQVTAPQRADGSGAVKSVRVAQNSPSASRLVIDLAAPATVSVDPAGANQSGTVLRLVVRGTTTNGFAQALKSGRRNLAVASAVSVPKLEGNAAGKAIVLDSDKVSSEKAAPVDKAAVEKVGADKVAAVPVATPAAASPSSTPVAASVPTAPAAVAAAVPATPKRLPVVVIDAGHGGQDPGAPSVLQGRWEKEVTLAIAKAIKAELDKSGKVRAVLTRSNDIFIPLGRRVDIAREAGASLFISIHADSVGRPDVHGATVYTLSEKASDKEAEKLAAKENKSDIIAGINLGAESPDVTDILIDLVQRETMNLSAEFAGFIVKEVGKHRYFRSNNHRFAGFRVLKAPDVPSVLLETGYMSNHEDSQYLFSEAGQTAIARGVRQAVEAYFQRHVAQSSLAAVP